MMASKYARGTVIFNGTPADVFAYRTENKGWKPIQHARQALAMLNAIAHSFTVTEGKGQGVSVKAYAYFTEGDELLYFCTGSNVLPEGAAVTYRRGG